jgi:dienelactone hydrolase
MKSLYLVISTAIFMLTVDPSSLGQGLASEAGSIRISSLVFSDNPVTPGVKFTISFEFEGAVDRLFIENTYETQGNEIKKEIKEYSISPEIKAHNKGIIKRQWETQRGSTAKPYRILSVWVKDAKGNQSNVLSGEIQIAAAMEAQVAKQTVWIPMEDKGLFSSQPIKLEATLYKPAGSGPFPVVIFNHGSTGPGAIPVSSTENPRGYATYLLKKGIALIIPMRRGRGKSEGAYNEPYDCSQYQQERGIQYAIESLDAVYDYLRRQEWANTHQIILSGTSRGGILSVVYAAERPGTAIGVINFVGGWMTDRCMGDVNELFFAEAGRKCRTPSLFLYAANDSFYSASSINRYQMAFRKGGGEMEYKLYTLPVGSNGHGLFYNSHKDWAPDVDRFLERLGVWKP